MPQISVSDWLLDYDVLGDGPPLLLLHSSLSGNKQWKPIAKNFSDQYKVISPNFFGYGKSSPWPKERTQDIDHQLDLIAPLFEGHDRIDLVGHSLGGAVALKAAIRYQTHIRKLVLLEPTQYDLITRFKDGSSYAEISSLLDVFERGLKFDDWLPSAEAITTFWHGPEAWANMGEHHRIAVTWRMPPVVHELRAILSNIIPAETLRDITAETQVIRARNTVPAIQDIFEVLPSLVPHWSYRTVEADGHMFPVSNPDDTYTAIKDFLES